jgi:hypothetical protein
MDPAFQSRVDLILRYTDLDANASRQVRKTFIQRLPQGVQNLAEADYDSLQQWGCNGREIKSAVKTGLILAKSEKVALGLDHLETVLKVREDTGLLSGKRGIT